MHTVSIGSLLGFFKFILFYDWPAGNHQPSFVFQCHNAFDSKQIQSAGTTLKEGVS